MSGVHRLDMLGDGVPLDAKAGDPAALAIEYRLERVALLAEPDIVKLQQPAPHAAFEHRAAEQQAEELARGVAQIATVVEPEDLVDHVAVDGTLRRQLRAQTRKQLLEHFAAAGEQAVRMTPLRHAFARLVEFRERIAFNYRYLIVVIVERARRQEASHARAHHDRMTTEMRHGTGFLFFVAALPPAHDTGGAGFGFGPGCFAREPNRFRASFFGEDVAIGPSPRAHAGLPARPLPRRSIARSHRRHFAGTTSE
jgi:hypothetical protein